MSLAYNDWETKQNAARSDALVFQKYIQYCYHREITMSYMENMYAFRNGGILWCVVQYVVLILCTAV